MTKVQKIYRLLIEYGVSKDEAAYAANKLIKLNNTTKRRK